MQSIEQPKPSFAKNPVFSILPIVFIRIDNICTARYLNLSDTPFMHPVLISIGLLLCSNLFMTFAWYAHLKELNHKPWFVAALLSWGIALLEYLFQVPANRIGYSVLSVAQLKIIQEVITLSIFVPFAIFYLREPLKLDYLWAGLCMVGAVYFMFRSDL